MTNVQTKKEFHTVKEATESFNSEIKKTKYRKDEMQELANIYAKHPADKYIIQEGDFLKTRNVQINQGDIVILPEGSTRFKKIREEAEGGTPAKNSHLQKGTALTGDHTVVGDVEILDFKADFTFPGDRIPNWEYKLLKASKAFVIHHTTHGNYTLPAGEYITHSQLSSKTLERVRD